MEKFTEKPSSFPWEKKHTKRNFPVKRHRGESEKAMKLSEIWFDTYLPACLV